MLRVLHLTGSAVDELYLQLSLVYARDCLQATADPARYDTRLAHVTPDGRWRFPADLTPSGLHAADPMPVSQALERIAASGIDVVVPQMFCRPGMTHYRALFDGLVIPYVGNSADVMSLAADKARAKAVVAAAGVPVPRGQVLRAGESASLPTPAVVKPVDADNSLGVSLVRRQDEYAGAVAEAFAHSDRVLIETYVELGREVRCGVLEQDGELLCLPLEEYDVSSAHRPVRQYRDKISRGDGGDVQLVAKEEAKAWIVDVTDPVTEAVWALARQCHRALGCRDYSLFDFRIDPDGQPWFLEAGLYCSFAQQSVISVMARAGGIALSELFDSSLRQALARQPTL